MTTSNITECKKRIDPGKLPSVYTHAISLARGLNIRYLWIDALCILQDSKLDWETEASRMANIYRNSQLVIAVSKASNVYNSALGQMHERDFGSVHARFINHIPPEVSWATTKSFPLLNRAWAFQERELALRVVHLGPQELAWECNTGSICECNPSRYEMGNLRNLNGKLDHNGGANTLAETVPCLRNIWRALVVSYSQLSLTFPADKLPALSGIAELMCRDAKYLAGCWSDSLAHDMMWYRDHSLGTPQIQNSQSRWRAPSWSWASVNGKISYPATLYSLLDRDRTPAYSIYCDIEDFECVQDGTSLTGKVRSGRVRLCSNMLACEISSLNARRIKIRSEHSDEAVFLSDGRDPKDDRLFVARMVGPFYIVVRPVEGVDNTFERVGWAHSADNPDHEHLGQGRSIVWPEEQTVLTIV